MKANRRTTTRYPLELPIGFDGGTGLSRDLGLKGIRFETSKKFEVGSGIRFSVTLTNGPTGEPIPLTCWGSVVRVSDESTRLEVAASIDHIDFAMPDELA